MDTFAYKIGNQGQEAHLHDVFGEQKKRGYQEPLRSAKAAGGVKISGCGDSVGYFGISVEELIPEGDEVQQGGPFRKEDFLEADRVLTF